VGNFLFGDSLDGSFSLLISPLPEFKKVFQIFPPVGPRPMEREFFIRRSFTACLKGSDEGVHNLLDIVCYRH
jgi:hypothetical protein